MYNMSSYKKKKNSKSFNKFALPRSRILFSFLVGGGRVCEPLANWFVYENCMRVMSKIILTPWKQY